MHFSCAGDADLLLQGPTERGPFVSEKMRGMKSGNADSSVDVNVRSVYGVESKRSVGKWH